MERVVRGFYGVGRIQERPISGVRQRRIADRAESKAIIPKILFHKIKEKPRLRASCILKEKKRQS
jgi:hypothetical protein